MEVVCKLPTSKLFLTWGRNETITRYQENPPKTQGGVHPREREKYHCDNHLIRVVNPLKTHIFATNDNFPLKPKEKVKGQQQAGKWKPG